MDDDCLLRRPPPAGECGEDHISCLPDELLHSILTCLGSVRAAARTSVLSRRWRRVWTYLPELVLSGDDGPPQVSSFSDTVDAALAACAAPALEQLRIRVPDHGLGIPAHRIVPWLRFASQRVTGRIFLNLGWPQEAEFELPTCGTATTITLIIGAFWKVRPGGVFAALTGLQIHMARMDGRELSDLVSTQCPCLRNLLLLVDLVAVFDVSIRSDSLHSLCFSVSNRRRLEVVAPKLEDLSLASYGSSSETRISAPKLVNVDWSGDCDPRRHQFTDVRHRLRSLSIAASAIPLMKKFNEIDQLVLQIFIKQGIAGYQSFLSETNNLSKCETLDIFLLWDQHGLAPAILHLFRCCNSIKKLSIALIGRNLFGPSLRYSCPLACPCRLAESCKIDDIALSLLGEVRIDSFKGSHEEMELVDQLSRCNAPVLKKLVIDSESDSTLAKELCEKVRSMFRPNIKVQFYAVSEHRRVLFD